MYIRSLLMMSLDIAKFIRLNFVAVFAKYCSQHGGEHKLYLYCPTFTVAIDQTLLTIQWLTKQVTIYFLSVTQNYNFSDCARKQKHETFKRASPQFQAKLLTTQHIQMNGLNISSGACVVLTFLYFPTHNSSSFLQLVPVQEYCVSRRHKNNFLAWMGRDQPLVYLVNSCQLGQPSGFICWVMSKARFSHDGSYKTDFFFLKKVVEFSFTLCHVM